ncbi:hypothetical protein K0651_07360 [Ornithinimicrobium sp. Arc0846-15]|nr:hypothetical protein [Ornithinimicrobium laminariae]
MSGSRAKDVWGDVLAEPVADLRNQPTQLPTFFLFILIPVVTAFPGAGVPINELAAVVIVGLSILRPARDLAIPFWAYLGLFGSILAVYFGTFALDVFEVRRMGHLAVWAGLALVLISGRVHIASAARGMAVSLFAGAALGLAGFNLGNYAGRLNSYWGDPNAAGFWMLTVGLVSIPFIASRSRRTILMIVIAVALLLTFSRTTLAAAVIAGVWLLIGRRLPLALAVGFVGLITYAVNQIPEEAAVYGPFSGREGSDTLREAISEQVAYKVFQQPWSGGGAGSARVLVEGDTFFFHNSYLAVVSEGGYVALACILIFLISCFVGLVWLPTRLRSGWMESALLAMAVVAVSLGEVWFDLAGAVVFGITAWYLLDARRRRDERTSRGAKGIFERGEPSGGRHLRG